MIILEPLPFNDAVLASSNVPENEYPLWNATRVYAPGDRVLLVDTDVHDVYEQVNGSKWGVTLSIGSPCEVTQNGHGFVAGQTVRLTTTGALPTGLPLETTLYVLAPTTNTYNLSLTPGGAAINTSGSQSGAHTLIKNQIGLDPRSWPTYWVRKSVNNRWAMFDAYNNTQTSNPESIEVTLTPTGYVNGIYLGGVDAESIDVEMVDPVEGIVYSQSQSMIQSNSGSSFYNWCFKRIVRRNVFIVVDLPMYLNPTINISINNAGGTAKCGMCAVGPLVDVGLSQYGLGTDIKDFSTTKFDVDGASETITRGFAKRMTLDVVLENDVIDAVQDALAGYRQTPVVWIGETTFRWTVQYGKYSSFKNVIEGETHSKMALTIESTI